MDELISIIIPIYNREKYLKTCLDSIINQTYTNLEIILVDDGSTDNSLKICEDYSKSDNRIVIISKKNGGVAEARNSGLEKAHGKYIAFVDSDDWIDHKAYEILLKNIKEYDADISVGAYIREYQGSDESFAASYSLNRTEVFTDNIEILRNLTDAAGFFNCFIWNKLYKRSIIGSNRFLPDALMSEDYFFNWQVLKKINRAVFTQFPVYHYRNYNESLTRRCPINNFLSAIKINKGMLDESKLIDKKVFCNILYDFLGLNLRAAELMIYDSYDEKIYRFLKNNIIDYRYGVKDFKLYRKILCNGFLINFTVYKIIYLMQKPLIEAYRKVREKNVKKRLCSVD